MIDYPLVAVTRQDIVYFGTLGSTVYARWEDGTSKWSGEGKVLIGGEELSTTVIYDYVANVYFGTSQNRVYSIFANDGSELVEHFTTENSQQLISMLWNVILMFEDDNLLSDILHLS